MHNTSTILSAVRTPIGKFGGLLSRKTAVELATVAVGEALRRAGVPAEAVDLTIVGHARQAGNGPNPARQVAIAAGIPEAASAWTLNQACASGLSAIEHAHKALLLGDAEVVVAAGMESMSRVPYLLENARWGLRLGHDQLTDGMYKDGLFCPMAGVIMGETVETLADDHGISRQEQDEYAAASQQRCEAARRAGRFASEIVGLEVKKAGAVSLMTEDEHPRDGVTAAGLARMAPVYKLAHRSGTITAANASGITDGASAMVMTTRQKAEQMGWTPFALYEGGVVAGCQPQRMGLGPVHAVEALLKKRADLSLDSFDLVELNEAFAAQVLACLRSLPIPAEKLNVNGGSIALGHPIGCSGNRIAVTLLHELRRRGGGRGLATLCVSGGLGIAGVFSVS
jgi:acetyl-CoA C-acetyltransferase